MEEDNESYLPILGNKIKKFFDKKGLQRLEDTKNGIIHIGNLTGCIRQSMIQEKYAEQVEDNNIYDYCNFMDGLDSEKILVDILDNSRKDGAEKGEFQKDIVFDNFIAHPDWIDSENEVIFELKSTAKIKPFILSDDTFRSYIRQIVLYMVLEGVEKGRILVRYRLPYFPLYVTKDTIVDPTRNFTGDCESMYKLMFHKDSGQFPFYTAKITIPLHAPIREQIKNYLKDIIKPIYLSGDIEQVPVLEDKPTNWKCKSYCKVKEFCDSIPDRQTDPDKRFVLLNKYLDESVDRIRSYGKRKDKNIDIS